ncbi:hypothetical protein BSL78_06534 [Apostichopus japonicus]|uniref:Iduronate 2-sulfatase n=1 Tax=Stichopus japonicus TaxID=307972 RepID=A0A2G8L8I5_STIJA|nr:hypothetical protein BSL78_06534 [Apostichopus japonicus]
MKSRLFQLFALLVVTFCHASSKRAKNGGRPNVLFIVIDDLRPKLGCYGEDIVSPNIDQLASKSMRFTNAHVQQAVCAPSRVSFLTGRRPDTTRLYDFGSYWRKAAGNYTTLPQYFKEQGYFSAGVGKVFHMGISSNGSFDYPYSWSIPNYWPSTEQYITSKVCITPEGKKHNLLCPVDLKTQPEGTLPDIQNADYAVDLLKNIYDGAPYVDFFGENQTMQEPFFVGLGFRKPHVPYKYPEEFKALYPLDSIQIAKDKDLPSELPSVAYAPYLSTLDNYDDIAGLNLSFPYGPMPIDYHYLIRQNYYSSVSYTDYQLGRVLSALDKYGFSDNTIISFVGDHGWQLGEHSEFSKFTNYLYATNVPLLFHVPGVTDRGVRSKRKFPLIHPLKFKPKPRTSMKPSGILMSASESTEKHMYRPRDQGPTSNAFAELVDLFPTVSDLAGLQVPSLCPEDSLNETLCREGVSLAPLIKSHFGGGEQNISNVKTCTISQYPRPSDQPEKGSILPKLATIIIMGYSMRTSDYRYSEWVGFNHTTFQMDWEDLHASELYILANDPSEDNNVAQDPTYIDIVQEMSSKLHQGWRDCIL